MLYWIVTVSIRWTASPSAFSQSSVQEQNAVAIDPLLISICPEYRMCQFRLCPARSVLDQKKQHVTRMTLCCSSRIDGAASGCWPFWASVWNDMDLRSITFDFLGFTHMWVRSRRGYLVLRQTTAKDRFARALRAVRDWCRRHRHAPLPAQREHLASVIRGHCAYYGRTGNSARLSSFRFQVIQTWRKWLSRRSRSARINWDQMATLLRQHALPTAKAVHSKLVA